MSNPQQKVRAARMSTAADKYVIPGEDGTYIVYNDQGNVALVTKSRDAAVALARRFDRDAS
jgi:hypothetical protein